MLKLACLTHFYLPMVKDLGRNTELKKKEAGNCSKFTDSSIF